MNVNYHLKVFEIKIYTSGINYVVPDKQLRMLASNQNTTAKHAWGHNNTT